MMVLSEHFDLCHIEVVEHACGMATLQMGEYFSNVSRGIDTFSIREPLGVCAGICPFNFPAMIPLWVSCLSLFGWTFGYCLYVGRLIHINTHKIGKVKLCKMVQKD